MQVCIACWECYVRST